MRFSLFAILMLLATQSVSQTDNGYTDSENAAIERCAKHSDIARLVMGMRQFGLDREAVFQEDLSSYGLGFIEEAYLKEDLAELAWLFPNYQMGDAKTELIREFPVVYLGICMRRYLQE